jgi:hypothetical protein
MPRALCALSGLVAAAIYLAPQQASAFEKQWHLGGGLGAARFTQPALSLGPALELGAAYGLTDMLDLKADLSLSQHTVGLAGQAEESAQFMLPRLSLAYKIDVLEWIPYVGVSVGYLVSLGSATLPDEVHNGLAIGGDVGIDYAVSRSFGLGVQFRAHALLQGGAHSDGFLRAEYRWGF